MSKRMGRNCGRKMKRRRGHMGGTKPRAMVVTVTVEVPLPEAKEFGATEQVVAVALKGRAQDKLTWAEKPFCAAMEIALVNVAVWPAVTVCVVVPEEVIEKSGGPVTVKLNGAEVPPGAGSTT